MVRMQEGEAARLLPSRKVTVASLDDGRQPDSASGASDKSAAYPGLNPVTPEDLTATLYYCLGIKS